MLYERRSVDYEDPILQDQELINIAKQALWDKNPYRAQDASIETVRERLHRPVPLIEITCKAQTPRELRDTKRREALIMALEVINNKASIKELNELIELIELREYQEEEYLGKNTIWPKNILNLKG